METLQNLFVDITSTVISLLCSRHFKLPLVLCIYDKLPFSVGRHAGTLVCKINVSVEEVHFKFTKFFQLLVPVIFMSDTFEFSHEKSLKDISCSVVNAITILNTKWKKSRIELRKKYESNRSDFLNGRNNTSFFMEAVWINLNEGKKPSFFYKQN